MARKKKEEETPEESDAVVLAVQAIEKMHGAGAIMFGGSKPLENVDFMSTGVMSLDKILGGGIPRGRIIELIGQESSGKTTSTLHMVAAAQERGEITAFIDAEHALDPVYAQNLGVDIKSLLISQPDSGEQALEIVDNLVSSGAISFIVVDSVAALVPRAELEGEMGDSHMGLHARLMSQAMRKLAGKVAKTKCTILFINQYRSKIGLVFGDPRVGTGGNALKFYASQRLEIRKGKPVKVNDEIIASKTFLKTLKNKVYPPFKECEFQIKFGEGIDRFNDVLNLAVQAKLLEKKGAWYAKDGENIAQGEANATQFLRDNPEVFQELWDRLSL